MNSHQKLCVSTIQRVLSTYPSQTAQSPEDYVRNLVCLMEGYPEFAVRSLMDPQRGIAAECKFLPMAAEVKAFLDDRCGEREKQRRRQPALPPPEKKYEKDPEVAKLLHELARSLKFPAAERKDGKPPSEARRRGWAQSFWDECEQTPEWKARAGMFRRTQSEPGAAIAEAMKADKA